MADQCLAEGFRVVFFSLLYHHIQSIRRFSARIERERGQRVEIVTYLLALFLMHEIANKNCVIYAEIESSEQ